MPVARIVQRGFILLCSLAGLLMVPAAAFAQAQEDGVEVTGPRSWWLPQDVSTFGHEVDWLFNVILWMTLIVGAAVFVVLIVFLIKYRYNPNRTAVYIHGNNKLEIVWTLVPALIMAATAALSQASWARMKNPADWPNDAEMHKKVMAGEVIHVEVIGQQFNWIIRYPGKDGKFGPRHVELIGPTDLNTKIGLNRKENIFKFKSGETLHGVIVSEDKKTGEIQLKVDGESKPRAVKRSDIASTESWGKDDIVASTLVVPVNKKVFIKLSSLDVLHSFFLPNMRVKQDAVPGLSIKVWFEATRLSEEVIGRTTKENATPEQIDFFELAKPYEIVCAELCGLGHSTMRGELFVVIDDIYNRWMKDQESLLPSDDDGF
ncbi:MAG: cytochrome c oxidase subunit II [Phycisphaeraceae bacterium]